MDDKHILIEGYRRTLKDVEQKMVDAGIIYPHEYRNNTGWGGKRVSWYCKLTNAVTEDGTFPIDEDGNPLALEERQSTLIAERLEIAEVETPTEPRVGEVEELRQQVEDLQGGS